MKKNLLVLLLTAVMILGVFGLTACGSTQGIPHGTYYSCNEDGVVTKSGLEYAWQIKDGIAEFLYLKYIISEHNEKVFFEYEALGSTLARKFEVKFDKHTKILSIYMPSDFASNAPTGEVKIYYYKKHI